MHGHASNRPCDLQRDTTVVGGDKRGHATRAHRVRCWIYAWVGQRVGTAARDQTLSAQAVIRGKNTVSRVISNGLHRHGVRAADLLITDNIHGEGTARSPVEIRPGAQVLDIAIAGVVIESIRQAIAVLGLSADSQGQVVSEGNIRPPRQFDTAEVTAGEGDGTTALWIRCSADHVDYAAGRILPEQGALRTAQHLDSIKIEKVQDTGLRTRHVDAIDIEADTRIDQGILIRNTDTADKDVQLLWAAGPGGADIDIGCKS